MQAIQYVIVLPSGKTSGPASFDECKAWVVKQRNARIKIRRA